MGAAHWDIEDELGHRRRGDGATLGGCASGSGAVSNAGSGGAAGSGGSGATGSGGAAGSGGGDAAAGPVPVPVPGKTGASLDTYKESLGLTQTCHAIIIRKTKVDGPARKRLCSKTTAFGHSPTDANIREGMNVRSS